MNAALTADGTVALEHGPLQVSLTLHAGEVVGLVGPNGAGKSATLRTLVGLHRLATGHIEVGGRVVDDVRTVRPPHRRGLGWAPQGGGLTPRRRARSQVAAFERATAPLADRGVDGLLHELGLAAHARTRPDGLSAGQIQRVAVARALLAGQCALLDEPTSAQDGDGGATIRRLVREHAQAGGTALVVAHRPEDAYGYADRLIVLEHGKVVQQGTPAALAAAPGSPYIAHVVGATVLHGTVGSDHLLRGPWGQLRVADDTPTGSATAIVRPASVALHLEEPASSSRNTFRGVVTEIHRGPHAVTVRVDGHPALVASITEAAAAELALRPGSDVWASVKATDIDVTPLRTGR